MVSVYFVKIGRFASIFHFINLKINQTFEQHFHGLNFPDANRPFSLNLFGNDAYLPFKLIPLFVHSMLFSFIILHIVVCFLVA